MDPAGKRPSFFHVRYNGECAEYRINKNVVDAIVSIVRDYAERCSDEAAKAIALQLVVSGLLKGECEAAIPVSLKELKTLCFLVGPPESFGDYLAGILAMHPNCWVSNQSHAPTEEERYELTEARMRLLREHQGVRKLATIFLHEAVEWGTNIFDSALLRDRDDLKETYGEAREDPLCVLWKEPARVSKFLYGETNGYFDDIFSLHEEIRFICPVRDPRKVAPAIAKQANRAWFFPKGWLPDSSPASNRRVVSSVKRYISRFHSLADKYPSRFLVLPEKEIFCREGLERVAKFLGLESRGDWLESAGNILKSFEAQNR